MFPVCVIFAFPGALVFAFFFRLRGTGLRPQEYGHRTGHIAARLNWRMILVKSECDLDEVGV